MTATAPRKRRQIPRVSTESPYLRLVDVAEYFGCTKQTIRRAVKRGKLKVVRLGGLVLIPRAELDRIDAGK